MRAVQHPSHHREQLNVLHTTARTVRDTGAVATWASDDRARGLGYRIGRLVDRELLGQLTTAPAIRLWGAAAASRSAAVELQDVVGAADELALGGCCHSASCHEVADVASTLDLSEDGFDDLLVLPVERAPRLGRDLAVHLLGQRGALPEWSVPAGRLARVVRAGRWAGSGSSSCCA